MTDGLAILLHGFGSNGDDLAGLAARWAPDLPDVRFSSPNAPERFLHGAGYQWFALDDITPENRSQRVADARHNVDRVLKQVLQQQKMADKLDKVVLIGFSQGAIMALDAVVSGRWPVAGVVAFSGRLASPPPWKPAIAPLLLIHGMIDPVIPYAESQQAADQLRRLGYPVTTQFEPSTGHTISAAGARSAAGFIAERLT
ncbi:phospholipase/carboxylesterase [Izhakiella capsodis]|uniref:Phospholipase/carboxylesterase n=1 Tax=Izhakiella capsodis TaxID=1367852 RepID=A0A1I4YTN5_9GAMM|nr:alpha/beta fold hydrolase [Izhakiella capsodis]SFN41133.1 phospholipase/carboxylesterase [Izhakiella capsodis]